MKRALFAMVVLASANAQEEMEKQLLTVKRVYVDKLTGGETAAQMRDLVISSLQGTKLFVLTENPDRADAILRGAAEDLVYTDVFQSSDGVDIHAGVGTGSRSTSRSTSSAVRSITAGAADRESSDIRERKHEALATVRLVNREGDVIWSTTQESNGAKFRGASADVAEKISRALAEEVGRLRVSKPGGTGGGAGR